MVPSQNEKDLRLCYSLVGKQSDRGCITCLKRGTVKIEKFIEPQKIMENISSLIG
jgi:hypothetical protein